MSSIHPGSSAGGNAGSGSGGGSSLAPSLLPAAALASRKLAFNASVPLLIELADPPASETRSIAQYYCKVPRISYLPLLLPVLRKYFLEALLDEATLLSLKEDSFWFEYNGQPLKWHWPVGLLYDVHTGNTADTALGAAQLAPSAAPASTRSASSPLRQQFDSYFSPSLNAGPGGGGHWQSNPSASAAGDIQRTSLPWRIRLHLKSPPADKLNMSSSVEACRSNFMSMVKEADFVRFGTTRRVVNLRRTEQDALWEGVVEHDFEKYWSVAARLLPPLGASSSGSGAETSAIDNGFHGLSISPSRTPSLVPSIASSSAASSSTNVASVNRQAMSPSGLTTTEGGTVRGPTSPYAIAPGLGGGAAPASHSSLSVANSEASVNGDTTVTLAGSGGPGMGSASVAPGGLRHIPIRIHLPDGAPVVQEPVAPYFDDGRPKTLFAQLSALFPLLFPPAPSFACFAAPPPPLAFVVIQGIRIPLEAEIAWLGAVLGGADGWVSAVVHLNPE
ncbi:hypothetical protein V8E36_008674 [Tilletia maclaganii]